MPGDTLEFISALLLPDASLFELSVPVYKEQASFPQVCFSSPLTTTALHSSRFLASYYFSS
ncbi:hypothetical protein QCA50_003686 [Cerrena zonata]|uniref:Uncharacterized protein n=1 Tax=Cerrena zonata TaxID=2478898 RepID=A0AAW0GLK7_9APHY